jgi:hypothetical protein
VEIVNWKSQTAARWIGFPMMEDGAMGDGEGLGAIQMAVMPIGLAVIVAAALCHFRALGCRRMNMSFGGVQDAATPQQRGTHV